ncbi:MAG: hypothetical protein RX317_06355, partial [bacterium]|nr:hypothetical protein [bacterium]
MGLGRFLSMILKMTDNNELPKKTLMKVIWRKVTKMIRYPKSVSWLAGGGRISDSMLGITRLPFQE